MTTGAFTAVARPPALLMAAGDSIAIIAATAAVGLVAPGTLPAPHGYAPLLVLAWLAPGLLVLAWLTSRGRAGRRAPGRLLLAGGLCGAIGSALVGALLLPHMYRAVGPAIAWLIFPAPALALRALLGQPAALLLLRDWRRGLAELAARLRDRLLPFDPRLALAAPAGKFADLAGGPRRDAGPAHDQPRILARSIRGPEFGLPSHAGAAERGTGAAMAGTHRRPAALFCKTAFDMTAAVAALLFLAPLMLLLAALVKLDGGPVLFAHGRIGRGGERFPCLKFRSMVTDSDRVLRELLQRDPAAAVEWAATQKLRHDPRITWIGRFMRKTSLDELPQLFNVLRGDMSLVGPRPIVAAEIVRYGDDIAYYLAARPGITGLWQVSGRSNTTYAERVALDTSYVRDWSLRLDASIVARTIPAVLKRKGAV